MTHRDFETFKRALFRETPAVLAEWRGLTNLQHDIEQRLKVEFDRCENQAFGESFHEACPVEGCEPSDYQQRIIDLGGGQRLLVGIRFRGGQTELPFVDLVAATHPLDDPAALDQAVGVINREFRAFDPQAVRLMRAADRPLHLPDGLEASVDYHFVAGRVGSLVADGAALPADSLQLQPTDDVQAAARFVTEFYEEFFDDHPHYREILEQAIVEPAEAEDLEQCAETGVLAYILIDGERAGLLATRQDDELLVTGQCVVEQILCKAFRGRGYAPIAQRRLAECLAESDPDTILWGTIDDRNAASRATARRNGRRELAAWYWLNGAQDR